MPFDLFHHIDLRLVPGTVLILIDGVAEHVPAELATMLREDGRAVLGTAENGVTRLTSARRSGDRWAMLPLAELGIPRLSAFDEPQRWQF